MYNAYGTGPALDLTPPPAPVKQLSGLELYKAKLAVENGTATAAQKSGLEANKKASEESDSRSTAQPSNLELTPPPPAVKGRASTGSRSTSIGPNGSNGSSGSSGSNGSGSSRSSTSLGGPGPPPGPVKRPSVRRSASKNSASKGSAGAKGSKLDGKTITVLLNARQQSLKDRGDLFGLKPSEQMKVKMMNSESAIKDAFPPTATIAQPPPILVVNAGALGGAAGTAREVESLGMPSSPVLKAASAAVNGGPGALPGLKVGTIVVTASPAAAVEKGGLKLADFVNLLKCVGNPFEKAHIALLLLKRMTPTHFRDGGFSEANQPSYWAIQGVTLDRNFSTRLRDHIDVCLLETKAAAAVQAVSDAGDEVRRTASEVSGDRSGSVDEEESEEAAANCQDLLAQATGGRDRIRKAAASVAATVEKTSEVMVTAWLIYAQFCSESLHDLGLLLRTPRTVSPVSLL